MKCTVCKHGETKQGSTTVTLERNNTTVILRVVPARVCQNCGEAYVDAETTREILKTAERAAASGVQVDIRNYKAA